MLGVRDLVQRTNISICIVIYNYSGDKFTLLILPVVRRNLQ